MRPALPTMMAHIFLVFFLIVPSLFQLASGTFSLDMSNYKEATATTAATLVLLFVVFFVLGGALAPKSLSRALRTIVAAERRRRGVIVIGFVLFAAAVAVATIVAFGFDTLLANRSSVTNYPQEEQTKATAGLFLDLPRAITFCAVLAVLYLIGRPANRRNERRRTVAILLALLIGPLFLVINYPQALPRFWMFGMAIALLLLYVDMRRVRNRLLLIVAMGGGVYTIFPPSGPISR